MSTYYFNLPADVTLEIHAGFTDQQRLMGFAMND